MRYRGKLIEADHSHSLSAEVKNEYSHSSGDRGGTVGAVLQIGRSPVRSQMVSLEFFIDIILPIALWPWDRLSL